MKLSWRAIRRINNATAADINRLLDMDCWHGEALGRLALRVEESAHEDPPNGYRLALECLRPIADHVEDDDMRARALTAAGAAARRLGRAGEAGQLYEQAKKHARTSQTWARLWLSIAVLAREEGRYEAALKAIDLALEEGKESQNLGILAQIISGTVFHHRGRDNNNSDDLSKAAQCFVESVHRAEVGTTQQISALVNLASVLEGSLQSADLRLLRPMLEHIRKASQKSRAKGIRRALAHAEWIEGLLAIRLGSTREGIRRLRKAGRSFARSGFHSYALRVAADVLEHGAEHGAETEAYQSSGEIAVLIPRDSPHKTAARLFETFEDGIDAGRLAADVRTAIGTLH